MKRFLAALFSSIILLGCTQSKPHLVIGSKNFTEQIILGELIAQHIEKDLHIPVERKLNLGGSFICHKALVAGDIDLYIEYTGTAYTAILKKDPKSDPDQVYREVKDAYKKQFDLDWMPPLGFNNTFAIIVRGEEARRLGLKTISDAARYTPRWHAGFGYEFMERKDGFPGLAATYNLKFADAPRTMDLSLTYRAVSEKQVDMIAGDTTNGLISKLDLFVLSDDKHYFPPYHAAPVVRADAIRRFPGLESCLGKLGGKISEEKMRQLNYSVDVEHRDVKKVAADFLADAF